MRAIAMWIELGVIEIDRRSGLNATYKITGAKWFKLHRWRPEAIWILQAIAQRNRYGVTFFEVSYPRVAVEGEFDFHGCALSAANITLLAVILFSPAANAS